MVKPTREQKMSQAWKEFIEARDEVKKQLNKMEFFMRKMYEFA